MAHIDYSTGQWVPDDAGPVPPGAAGAGSIDQQGLSPVAPPSGLIKPDEPFNIPPGPAAAAPPPVPAPTNPTAPAGAPQVPTAPAGAAPPTAPQPAPPVPAMPPPGPMVPPLPAAPPPVSPAGQAIPDNRPGLQTRTLISPAEAANLGNIDQTRAAQRDQSVAAGDVGVTRATNALGEQTEVEKERARQLKETQAAKDAAQPAIDRLKAQAVADNATYRKYRDAGLKDPEADQGFLQRLLTGLAVGLGQYDASMNHHANEAAAIIKDANAQNLMLQKDKIERARQAAIDSGADVTQAQAEATNKLHELAIKQAATIDAVRDRWKTESLRLGIPEARIAANQTTLGLDKASEDAKEAVYASARTKVTDMTPQQAKAGKGGGGGGDANALADFIERAGALKPGEAVPRDLAALGKGAGFKATQIADQVDKYRNSGGKSQGVDNAANKPGAAGGVDPKLIVHDVDGKPLMLASTARAVPQIQSDLRTNQQALQQLQDLKKASGVTSLTKRTPQFHDAVLGLAAVTTAGKTDTTTEHEEGTLTNAAGIPDNEAIDRKIEQVTTRIRQLKAQGNPLPEGYGQAPASAPDKARAAKAVMNGEPAPKGAAKPPAAASPQIQQAQDWIAAHPNDPRVPAMKKKIADASTIVL